MTDVKSLDHAQLKEWMAALGEKPFRGEQLYKWLHVRLAESYGQMSDLPLSLRERLERDCPLTALSPVKVQVSALDGTRKYLFALSDGNLVESVWMQYRHGNSVCISSQAGCRMGCAFCASTLDGLARNLTPSEMLEQVYAVQRDTGERVSHVVVMGTGEPLDNYENLLIFLRMLTDEYGLHISQRSVTVSTCGLVPQIRALAKEELQITLALSLHAASDEKRSRLMPVARRYSIGELMEACRFYAARTGRRITFEYSLLGGINDSDADAALLSGLAASAGSHVNLIPVNPVRERQFVRPDGARIAAFKNKLEKNGINVTIRREMGRDIDGACGQLRHGRLQSEQRGERGR